MYIPKANEENRLEVLHDLIESHPLASLVTMTSSGLFASHLPMVLERKLGTHGLLKGHLSRANKQWRDFQPAVEALAIFSGPEHYITPSWYAEKEETGKVVPTWNYAVVHVYGHLKVIEDPAWLLEHLNALTTVHESTFPTPWQVSDAPADYVESLLKGIVGLELPIERIEGKWKASQNRSERDRAGIIEGLEELETPESLAMKALVATKQK
ncbi:MULTISPECIES: FMN-binding negative transcriptional regulator [Acidobacteriaceae]|uniref:FMN-binding negative transcriptional regulator n=1 Tax=Acidobacteriaceae TaxID=204434 RepID=UPI00131D143A|nr:MULTISPECIES: FMN-binding negative transcriptional regulator [Acidobacteriaceae]MDW5264880.1 FMN-binding negative transcriptional regulator [Edaphobacter sp.]